MFIRIAILMTTLAQPALGVHGSPTSLLSFDVKAAKNRPVSKVITLLKDMLVQLQKDAEEDEEIYDKIGCWCETNDKTKTKSITDAEATITDLTGKIEEGTAEIAQLTTEIKNLEKEVAKHQDSLDKATAIRQKELGEFNAEEKDLLESIAALKSALVVLSKHHGGSLMQVPRTHILSIAATLDHEIRTHGKLLRGVLTHTQRKVVASFVEAPADYLEAPAYAPQSGQIFGVLNQMKETFEANLSDSQKEEMAKQKSYEELKVALEDQIAAAQAQLDMKTQQVAVTSEKVATAKEDLTDTRAQLSADEKFLMMLKEKCQMTDQEWEERQKTRQLEIEAVSKALAVLSSDDAHDLFTKTFNPSFVQASEVATSVRREKASELLRNMARQLQSPRLADIAVHIRLDAFTRVKKAIDDMIAQLVKEKQDEIKHKDFCVDEQNQNQLHTETKEREKTNVEAKMEDLQLTIKTLTQEIEALKAEIAEMQLQMKRAGEDRQVENKEFQVTIADQRATQKLLQQALVLLKGFYDKTSLLAVGHRQEPAGPPPPPGFTAYKKNAAAGGVLGMIQQIINDAKAMEAQAIRAEEDGQKAYEDFVKETNGSIEAKSNAIVDKTESKARSETDLVDADRAKDEIGLELEQLSNYDAELHSSCDFVMKNFELRQAARGEEIEALKQAKAILSGAKFEAFVEQ